MKRVLRHASVLLLLALLCCLVPRAAWAADVSDNCDKPKNIEVNKVYTGAFEKQGDRDCYRFKSGGGKFKLVVWFIPGKADSYDSRIDLMYGTYGTWSAIAGEAPEYMFGSEGIMSHWITGPLSYETAGVDYVLDGSYVRKTIDLGTFKKGKEAGIVLDGRYKGAYKFKVVGKKYVVRKSIKDAKVTVTSPTYSGLALKPKVTVKLGTKTLKSGTDYSLTFSKNINAGSNAVVKVTGKGNYKDSVSKKFTIKQRSVSNSVQITLNTTSYTYNGKAKKPSFSIYLPATNAAGMVTMQNKVDYTYKYENNVEPGTAKLVVTGKGNFTGTTTRTFKINKLKQPAALKSAGATVNYQKIGKTVSISVTGAKESPKVTYSTSNAKVAAVSSKGVVTFKGGGTANITVKLAATKHYKAANLTYKVVVLKQQKIATSVKSGAKIKCTSKKVPLGAKLTAGNGKLTYKSSDPSVVKVDSAGNLYFSGVNKVGTATITITAAQTSTCAKATKEIAITTVKGKPVLSFQGVQDHNREDAPFSLGVTASEPVELTYASENEGIVTVNADGVATINSAAVTEDVVVKVSVQSKATGIYSASDKAVIELKIHVISLTDPVIYMKQSYGSSNCTLYACAHMMRRRAILDHRSDWEQISQDAVENENSELAKAVWINGQGLRGEFSYKLADGYTLKGYCVETQGMSAETMVQLLKSHPEGIEVYDTGIPHAVLITSYDEASGVFYCTDSDPGQGSDAIIPLADCLIGDRNGSNQDNVLATINKYWYLA